jgi:hypothetical protein
MLLIDFEGGESTLAGLSIDVVRVRSWEEYKDVFETLANDESPIKYKSVGIDSISETHLWALLTLLEKNKYSRSNPDLIQQGDYGVASTQMRRLLREFRDLPFHVFFTSLAQDVSDPKEGMIKKPALSGKMADEVPGIMDVVGYMGMSPSDDTGEVERVLCLKNYPKMRVKIRTPWNAEDVPDEIVDPTVTKLLDVLGIAMPTSSFRAPKKDGTAVAIEAA